MRIGDGVRLPAMSAKKSDGDSGISTCTSRPSNCSDTLRSKRGQSRAPGMIERRRLIIWQPLHTPSAKLSLRAKNATNISASVGLWRIVFAQPPPGPEHVAIREAAARDETLEVGQRLARIDQVGHVHVDRREPGAVECDTPFRSGC